ncbi:hypothetical protein J7L48_09875 [bacterium]|nr:hypothetical protein [bacterium]
MSYEESKDRELFEKLLQRVAGLEEKVNDLAETINKLDFDKVNRYFSIELYNLEKKLREEEQAEKFITTFFKGRFQTCEVCGKFKFIEKLTDKHVVCNTCYDKYIKKGISVSDAKKIAKSKK